MIYRGLYHFYVARHQGLATDPVSYFARRENQDLGIVKAIRKPPQKLISGAQWNRRYVPQMLKLRCAYLNGDIQVSVGASLAHP